jgi:hypothetical protein
MSPCTNVKDMSIIFEVDGYIYYLYRYYIIFYSVMKNLPVSLIFTRVGIGLFQKRP